MLLFKQRQRFRSKPKTTIVFALLCALMISIIMLSNRPAAAAQQTAKWRKSLPGDAKWSSPAVEDINGDNRKDVIIATENGWVLAFTHDGTELWRRNLADYYASSSQAVRGSVTVADIDNNGDMEVIVPTGDAGSATCHPGSVIVLDHNGNKASGSWPFLTVDESIAPSGCPDGVLGTPAAGDIDNDGDLEIIFGSADKRIYALHHNGTLVNGFPANSYLRHRFPTWIDFDGKLADTIWSSPALGDIDNDGYLDVLIGADEGNFGKSFGGETIGWTCPYDYWGYEYCGGSMYVLNRNGGIVQGNLLDGGRYPILNWEIIQSTPAVADLNGDGQLDFVFGTGTFYTDQAGTSYGRRVRAIDGATGLDMAGWDNSGSSAFWGRGRVTNSPMPSSPAVGDMDGDGDLEVAILGRDQKVYAFHHTGSPVSGFPVTARSRGMTMSYDVDHHVVMGDYDGDEDMELILTLWTDVVVIDGDGNHLTDTGSNGNKPSYVMNGGATNGPALGDLDNNGKLEVVAASNEVVVWEFPNSSSRTDWPQFKNNAARQSRLSNGGLSLSSDTVTKLAENNSGNVIAAFTIENPGDQEMDWTIDDSALLGGVSISKNSGTLNPGQSTLIQVSIQTNSRAVGSHNLGAMDISATSNGSEVPGSPQSVPVVLLIADQVSTVFLPVITR